MKKSAALISTISLIAFAGLAGCSSDDAGSASAADGTLSVLASFYPLQYVAQQVGGEHVTTSSMTPPGAEPHDLELSPAQTRNISDAALVVYLSGFQPAVDEAIDQRQPAHVVDAATTTTLIPASEHASTAEEEHSTGDTSSGTASESDSHDGHDHEGDLDPHFWLDPTRMTGLADAVEQQLAQIDPDHADNYAANAQALKDKLATLDSDFKTGLNTCQSREIVTSHEAFGYLADRYDLTEFGITGLDPEAEPSPARLREVGDIVREHNVTTIFFEAAVSPKVAETLAQDLGIKAALLDPIETQVSPDADYVDVMRTNLASLRTALVCS